MVFGLCSCLFFLHLSERRRGHAIVMYSICHYKDSLRLLRSVLGSREKDRNLERSA